MCIILFMKDNFFTWWISYACKPKGFRIFRGILCPIYFIALVCFIALFLSKIWIFALACLPILIIDLIWDKSNYKKYLIDKNNNEQLAQNVANDNKS